MNHANDTIGRHLAVAIVGVGPRGLSVLERSLANERASPSHAAVTIHLIDPFPPGPGRVWRTRQSAHLLMNTVASQVTVFTDDSVEVRGPIEPGPSLYAWARSLVGTDQSKPQGHGYDAEVLEEARRLGPDTYPTRVLYGHYLEDVFESLVSRAPAHVRVRIHSSRAVSLDDELSADGSQVLVLDNGERLGGLDAVVLCQGHVDTELTKKERRLSRQAEANGLTYVPPANPADVDLSAVKPNETVLLRGLGLNFFDYMALLTTGRGGTFERSGGRLVYRASGMEPRMYAGSRRGVPYHARGENEKGPFGRYEPRLLTAEWIATLRRRALEGERVRFGTHLWPLIAKEVESTYYDALLTERGRNEPDFVDSYLATPTPEAERALLARVGIAEADYWDWDRVARPYGDRRFADQAEFRAWLLDYLRHDVRHASAGNVSDPLKAALDVLRDLRNEVRLAVDHRGLEGNSHRDELYGWYTPLNAFVSIGPPISRVDEMIALVEAGLLDILGPGMTTEVDHSAKAFVASSQIAETVTATSLIEARLPETDLRRTADPLLRHLLETGQCAPYRIPSECGSVHETGGLAVTERPYHLVDARGRAHPRRFVYGIPTESVHWVTAAGIRPGVSSVTLTDSDAIARTVLALIPGAKVSDVADFAYASLGTVHPAKEVGT